MLTQDKQLSPNQVIVVSGFPQGAPLPTNQNIHQFFGNCGQIQSIHPSNHNIFVVFDTIGAARAALQLKHDTWEIRSLGRAPEEIVAEFQKSFNRSWDSRPKDAEFGNNRPISPRPADMSLDDRMVADSGWAARRRPGEMPMDYERSAPNQGSMPPTGYRGPPDSSFADPMRGRGDMPPRDSLDRPRGARSPGPPEFRRPLSPPLGPPGPPDSSRYDGSPVAPMPRRGPPVDYPSSYGPGDRPMVPRDARGPYPDERYRRELSPPPPPQWNGNKRRLYEDPALEVEAGNKRLRLSDGGDPRPPRDYPPVDSRRGPMDPPLRPPPPRGAPDAYPPPPPGQYRSRTMDDQYPPPPGRYGRDEAPRYRSNDEFDAQYRRGSGGPPYSAPHLESGPGYRGSISSSYSGYSETDSLSSRGKPLPPVGRPMGPPLDYPPPFRVDDRRAPGDYRAPPEDYPRRFSESDPPSRMSRPDDPRRGYMDSYPPPALDDRRYDSRRYEGGPIDRDYDRRGPPSQYPPGPRPSSPPRTLASRLGVDPRGSAVDAPSGPRYRGSEYDAMMVDGPPGPYRDAYRDRDRFDDPRAGGRPGFDLRDRGGYDPRDRERPRDVDRERERPRERERDRDYVDDRYRREGGPGRPFDRNAGTRVSGQADGTVIFVSNLPAQVSQPRFRRLFGEAIGIDNVMDVNTGRAGFAFVRIRSRELAEEAVSKLHHVEFAPKFKMNVTIGKPPHEYRKWKNSGYQGSKRAVDKAGGLDSKNPNKKKKKNKKNRPSFAEGDKDKAGEAADGDGGEGEDSGDESVPGSDADGTDIRHGDRSAHMTQEDIEAFMETMAKEAGLDQPSNNDEEHSASANITERFDRMQFRSYPESEETESSHYARPSAAGSGYAPTPSRTTNDTARTDTDPDDDAAVAEQLEARSA